MATSEALIVGEDWISEHYFTTDAKSESFLGRVLERRKEWDAEDGETTRSRFLAARGDLESRLIALAESTDATTDLYAALTVVLGFTTGQYRLQPDGPLTWVTPIHLDESPRLAILHAKPVESIEDLIAKDARSLVAPWKRDEDTEPVASVASALSTLMVDADGPDFALVLAGRWCLIAEKERWPEGRWLAVDLQLVCERHDTTKGGEIDRALACLDAASLAPDASGDCWWRTTLDESVKHTVGVSKDLREGVRTSIEIIANEVVRRRRDQDLPPLPDKQAQPLAIESLRYLYRILFLLYAEASPELGVLPVGDERYDAGYGLDRLRDLALTDIHSERSRGGTHLYQSLGRLFALVDEGHTPPDDAGHSDGGLTFRGLSADLFRPKATALIDEVGLGNEALLHVLRKLLLSQEKAGKDRGFISYVELGINQLGAVYEGLMSYTGSFAHEDMYEVAKNGDPTDGSWVVPIDRADHLSEDDFVREYDERTGEDVPVIHRRGEFVFRLSGRDRQRSASYYTPEVLTRFTVQQALEELLDQDGERTTAEEILGLTVCEPALGSGAFAIEAVRQLAEAYLSRREEETGERVPPDERPAELQKVKAHIALHQVYGVDLNATAVELAEISLWLDTMVADLQAPWFGLRLRRGNSLVGARRATYAASSLSDKGKPWLTSVPRDEPMTALAAEIDSTTSVEPAETRALATGRVHHFLIPAQGWGSAADAPKSVKEMADPERLKALKVWRSSVRRKPSATQVRQLEGLARRVEVLWGTTLRRLRIAEAESSRSISLWGKETQTADGVVTRRQIEDSLANPNGAYRRLRLVMDAWCALWFWPLTEDEVEPPTFEDWLNTLRDILGMQQTGQARGKYTYDAMTSFGHTDDWEALGEAEQRDLTFAGAQSIEAIIAKHPWLRVCQDVAAQQGFFHWELDFATVFARGGFDLQVGNPPWVRPVVDVDSQLADGDPWWALADKPSEASREARRIETLALPGVRRDALAGTTESAVLSDFLADSTNYPVLSGQPDLYRAFICQAWQHASERGVSALIHYDTHFTDRRVKPLRRSTYRHLRRHWHFINELKLFDMGHHKAFGVNVYARDGEVRFQHATAIYHPETIVRSFRHDGTGREPGLKDDAGRWDQRPHYSRIQQVDDATLRSWAAVSGSDTASSTTMVYTVNAPAARTLLGLAESRRIESLTLDFSAGWHEKSDSRRGRFERSWGRVGWSSAILQGRHFYISSPLSKAPPETGKKTLSWVAIDMEGLSANASPITEFVPAGDPAAYDRDYTHWGRNREPARDFYRVAWRRRVDCTGARTFISTLLPPGAAHVNQVESAAVGDRSLTTLATLQGVLSSLLTDFFTRASSKADVYPSDLCRLPWIAHEDHPLHVELLIRVLRLNCLTDAYAPLWEECWDDSFAFVKPILDRLDEAAVGPIWIPTTPLRRAIDRRNAQVEIDTLVAIMLGVPADDLCTVYRTQFGALRSLDQRDHTYDANGRLVPNSVLSVWRKKGDAITEDERTATHPGSGIDYVYELPFATRDREADFRTAYAEFERRLTAGRTHE